VRSPRSTASSGRHAGHRRAAHLTATGRVAAPVARSGSRTWVWDTTRTQLTCGAMAGVSASGRRIPRGGKSSHLMPSRAAARSRPRRVRMRFSDTCQVECTDLGDERLPDHTDQTRRAESVRRFPASPCARRAPRRPPADTPAINAPPPVAHRVSPRWGRGWGRRALNCRLQIEDCRLNCSVNLQSAIRNLQSHRTRRVPPARAVIGVAPASRGSGSPSTVFPAAEHEVGVAERGPIASAAMAASRKWLAFAAVRLWRNLAKRSAADCTEADLSSGRLVASAAMGARMGAPRFARKRLPVDSLSRR